MDDIPTTRIKLKVVYQRDSVVTYLNGSKQIVLKLELTTHGMQDAKAVTNIPPPFLHSHRNVRRLLRSNRNTRTKIKISQSSDQQPGGKYLPRISAGNPQQLKLFTGRQILQSSSIDPLPRFSNFNTA